MCNDIQMSDALKIMKLMVKLTMMSKGEEYHPVPSAARSHTQLCSGVSKNVIYTVKKIFCWTAKSAFCKADFISHKVNMHFVDGMYDK